MAAVGLHGRTGEICGQVQKSGVTAELFPPVSDLPGRVPGLQPCPLPGREIAVLDGQIGQLGLSSRAMGVIARSQFFQQNGERPAIGHDVMHDQGGQVLLVVQTIEGDPQQRALGQIEGLLGQRSGAAVRLLQPSGCGLLAQVLHRRMQGEMGMHPQPGLAIHRVESGAQHFMALQDVIECGLERREVYLAPELHRGGDVVERRSRLQMIQEPEPLLGKGEGRFCVRRQRLDGDAGQRAGRLGQRQVIVQLTPQRPGDGTDEIILGPLPFFGHVGLDGAMFVETGVSHHAAFGMHRRGHLVTAIREEHLLMEGRAQKIAQGLHDGPGAFHQVLEMEEKLPVGRNFLQKRQDVTIGEKPEKLGMFPLSQRQVMPEDLIDVAIDIGFDGGVGVARQVDETGVLEPGFGPAQHPQIGGVGGGFVHQHAPGHGLLQKAIERLGGRVSSLEFSQLGFGFFQTPSK